MVVGHHLVALATALATIVPHPDCSFPFTDQDSGITYTECTLDQDHNDGWWCATEVYANNTIKDWDYCTNADPNVIADPDCVFPVVYEGVRYNDTCIESHGDGYFWCATSVNADLGYETWAYCGVDLAAEHGLVVATPDAPGGCHASDQCVWQWGDAGYDSHLNEDMIGIVGSEGECAQLVRCSSKYATAATYAITTGECYAEFGVEPNDPMERTATKIYLSCIFDAEDATTPLTDPEEGTCDTVGECTFLRGDATSSGAARVLYSELTAGFATSQEECASLVRCKFPAGDAFFTPFRSHVFPLFFFARALWQIAPPSLGDVAAICHRPLGGWRRQHERGLTIWRWGLT